MLTYPSKEIHSLLSTLEPKKDFQYRWTRCVYSKILRISCKFNNGKNNGHSCKQELVSWLSQVDSIHHWWWEGSRCTWIPSWTLFNCGQIPIETATHSFQHLDLDLGRVHSLKKVSRILSKEASWGNRKIHCKLFVCWYFTGISYYCFFRMPDWEIQSSPKETQV